MLQDSLLNVYEEQKYHQAYFLNAIVFAEGIEGGFSEACALVFSATFPIFLRNK